MSTPIFRNRPRRDFTVIRNTALRDPNLSLKAKGVLALMLSYPDDWTYHLEHLERQSSDGRDATRAAVRELEDCGYVRRRQHRTAEGKLAHTDYEVADDPATVDGKPVDGSTGDGKTVDGKPAATKTYLNEEPSHEEQPHQHPARAIAEPAPTEVEVEVDQELSKATNAANRRQARNYATAILAQQHPDALAGLQDLQSVYSWRPGQYGVIADQILTLARDHGGTRVATAITATLGSGAEIRQPLTYVRKILEGTPAAAPGAEPPALRSLDDVLGGMP